MKKLLTFIFIQMFIACSISTMALAKVKNNKPAPQFRAIDTRGNLIDLSAFKGNPVVLEWTNPECPFVVKHYQNNNMQNLQKKFTDQGVVWLSIISSAPGKQGYSSDHGINSIALSQGSSATAIIRDPSGKIGRLYKAKTTPHMFIIDRNGTLVYQGAIDSIRSWDPEDIKDAKNYVDAALTSLLNGKKIKDNKTKPYGCSVKY